MSALILELARTVLFLSSSPLTFRLRIISPMLVLTQHGEVKKALPVVRLATHKLLVSVDDVVGLELLVTTLADKHNVTVMPNLVMVKSWQRLQILVTDIIVLNPLSLSLALYFCAPPAPSSSITSGYSTC